MSNELMPAELVTADWLRARGAVEDVEHPGEWFLPFARKAAVGESYRLVVDLKGSPGVCWEVVSAAGQTLECPTLIYEGLTVGRLLALCRALDVPLAEADPCAA